MIAAATPLIRDAGSISDLWEAARTSGGAREVVVSSDDSDGALHRTASDLLTWATTSDNIMAALPDSEALRRELYSLVHRAHTRARLRAWRWDCQARIHVAITREGDHLLALLTEA